MLTATDRIQTKEQLKDWLKYECSKYSSGGIRFIFPVSEADILRKHQILLCKTEYYSNAGNKIIAKLYKLRLSLIQNRYAIHIPINTCGRGLKVMHVGPILINGRVSIGQNCSLHVNTALVAGGINDEVPHLGDGVVIGVGAVILGGVNIADNIAVGANAVVNKNFDEPDIAIAGVPARKVSNNGRTQWEANKKLQIENL